MGNEGVGLPFILTMVALFGAIVLAIVAQMRIDQLEDRLQKIECAFIIEEDGSASPRTSDLERFRCINND